MVKIFSGRVFGDRIIKHPHKIINNMLWTSVPSHHFSATADDAHDGDTLFRAFLNAQPISHPHVRLRDYSPQPQMVNPMVIKHILWTL